MCGRYYTRRQKQEIAEHFRAGKVFDDPFAPNYNVAPTTFQPAIRLNRDSSEREMVLLRWGLVPFFAASLAEFKGSCTFNARAETIASSATWRESFYKRRCLIPADGFYEWKALNDWGKPKKQPYAISLTSGEPMAFAGLWDTWKEPKKSPQTVDRWLQSFAIVTTVANEIMAPIYPRMPVILAQCNWAEWLERGDCLPPAHLLRPFDSDAMRTDCCNLAVGNVRNNGPEMLNSA